MGKSTLVQIWLRAFLNIVHGIIEVTMHHLWSLVYGGPGEAMPPIKDLMQLESATSIALKIRTKKVTSLQVMNSFIERIEEVNPLLNAVVARRYDDARKEAIAADAFIKSGVMTEEQLAKDKPFLGVPFTTKDCISVKGMINTAGLWRRRDCIATEDAEAITAIRNVGAIPIALTNVSELCMWWESNNPVHGKTSNPYNTNHIVGGSSGGEGCLQGAAGSAFGVGSDIGGSIRIPAFFNGVFGHKPTKFTVSNKGQYPSPVSKEQDSFLGVGPMCRRAEDLLPLLKIMAGTNAPRLRLDDKVDLKDVKFYYQDNDGGGFFVTPVNSQIKDCMRKVVQHLHKAHNIKAKKTEIKRYKKSVAMWLANMKAKGGPSFADQLANLDGTINVWWELFKCFFRCSHHTLIGLCTALVEDFGLKYGSEEYVHMVEERDKLRQEMKDILGQDGVFIYPTHPTPAPYHHEPLMKPFNFSYTAVINILGFPATHCPMGLSKEGLPIGLQVIANDNNDRLCLAVAREIEKAFGGWVPPAIEA